MIMDTRHGSDTSTPLSVDYPNDVIDIVTSSGSAGFGFVQDDGITLKGGMRPGYVLRQWVHRSTDYVQRLGENVKPQFSLCLCATPATVATGLTRGRRRQAFEIFEGTTTQPAAWFDR